MSKFKFVEPVLIKVGSDNLRLGFWQESPKVDCRVIWEDNYQYLMKMRDQRNEMIEMLKKLLNLYLMTDKPSVRAVLETQQLIKEATEL